MFQRAMDIVLQGIPGVVCYIDDILVSGDAEEQHLDRLEQVFKRLHEYGLRLKLKKCDFLTSSVEYLGHGVDKQGLHPLPSKVKAIVEAPEPRNVQELRSFLVVRDVDDGNVARHFLSQAVQLIIIENVTVLV